MKPESLKQLAEYMGYKELEATNGKTWYSFGDVELIYDPINNAEQCLELMEKLKIDVVYWHDIKEWSAEITDPEGKATSGVYGESINEAVTNAAIVAVKE